jgi:16S rRNA A1518/A1519 N6-dimethyltransferase RsmA/KsgA/DIM1 with predicted DNA glycosylase/AP lyase activity
MSRIFDPPEELPPRPEVASFVVRMPPEVAAQLDALAQWRTDMAKAVSPRAKMVSRNAVIIQIARQAYKADRAEMERWYAAEGRKR